MKLIRLESDGRGSESIFSNNLGVPLTLGKKGQVALKTFCIDFTVENVEINKDNNSMFVTYGDDAEQTEVTLVNGVYSKSNFLDMLTNCLNRYIDTTDLTRPDLGLQWLVQLDDAGKVQITAQITDLEENVGDGSCDLNNVVFNNGIYTKIGGTDNNNYNGLIKVKNIMCSGGFYYSAKVSALDFTGVNFAFYIDSNNQTNNITNINTLRTRMTAGIVVQGANYLVKSGNGNSFYDTGISPQDNDIISICNNNGFFQCQYTRNGNTLALGDGLNMITVNPNFGTDLNNCIIKIGNDSGTIQFSELTYTPSSLTYLENSKLIIRKKSSALNVLYDDNLNADPIKITINFGDGELNKLLGFVSTEETSTGTEFSFEAGNQMATGLFENDVVVELLQGNTDSYDHTYKTKRNIISVIPSGDIHNSTTLSGVDSYRLSYTEQYPVWISFNNFGGNLTFSQLTLRISSSGSLLTCKGKISSALLFKDETDLMA